jgi:hypothetical protein
VLRAFPGSAVWNFFPYSQRNKPRELPANISQLL